MIDNQSYNTTLGKVATYYNGRAFKPEEWESDGLPIIRIQNLNDNEASFHYSTKLYEERYLVHNGDLLFAWAASLGAHIWKGQDAWLNQHIFKVVPHESIDKTYLYYYLLKVISDLYAKTHGSGMVHITKKPFMETPIFIPSLDKQKRIVAKIEELFSNLDASVAELQLAKEKLELYRQAVLKEAFVNHTGWKQYLFSDLMMTVKNGYGQKPDDDGNYKMLRISSVRPLRLNLEDIRYMLQPCSSFKIKMNDLLFTRYNGSVELVGVCARVPQIYEQYFYPDKIIKCTPKLDAVFHSKFLEYYMNQGAARKYIRSKIKTTSGQNGIAGTDIKNTVVYLPSDEEQKAIVEKIECKLSTYNYICTAVEKSLIKVDILRQSILKQAFEGKL